MADLPTPPPDPRTAWDLPPPGRLPASERLDELTSRILAPNPSPMTLDGTNTYVLASPGHGEAVVVDPGPPDATHLDAVCEVLRERDLGVAVVLVTHHHVDHAEAAADWARRFGARLVAAAPEVAGPHGVVAADGDRVAVAGLSLEVVATPGHTADHLAFRCPTGAVLTGDHVLGRGTSVVAHPDGDLLAYLASLRRLHDLGPDALYPGHGPAMTQDPGAVLDYYHEHRGFRRQQILAALGEGPATPADLVARIYADVDRRLWPAAEASTRAALAALDGEGLVVWDAVDRVRRVEGG
jgi:glyoxylase-like metal-dependent hydrolase (beta-lactamase superfamily II)